MISANFSCYMSPCQFGQNMHLSSLAARCCYFVLDIDIETAAAGCGDSGDMYRMSRIPSSLPTLHITCYVKHGHAPHSSSCVFTLSFRLCFGNNPITCPLALHTVQCFRTVAGRCVRGCCRSPPPTGWAAAAAGTAWWRSRSTPGSTPSTGGGWSPAGSSPSSPPTRTPCTPRWESGPSGDCPNISSTTDRTRDSRHITELQAAMQPDYLGLI